MLYIYIVFDDDGRIVSVHATKAGAEKRLAELDSPYWGYSVVQFAVEE